MSLKSRATVLTVLALVLISLACGALQPTPAPTATGTYTPVPTSTVTTAPTDTPEPSATPRPTQTPNVTATQRAAELQAEVQQYYDLGYLAGTEGRLKELDDFRYEWAQLGWYQPYLLRDPAGDFFLSAHFRWESAFQNADISGCGFLFALQENGDHYAVFLDRTKVLFLLTDRALGFSRPVEPTRGTGRVKFSYPAEADFTLIVKGVSAYILVNGENAGEYTLAQSRPTHGKVGLTVLSGTNRDYGTRCEMTRLHLWLPAE